MRQKVKSSAFATTSVDHFKKNLRSVSVWKFRLNPLWSSSFSLSLFVKRNGHSGKVLMWGFVSPATQIERRLSARHGCNVPTRRGDGSWRRFTLHSVFLRAAATAWTSSDCADTEHFLSFFSHQTKKIPWRTLTSRSPRYCKNKTPTHLQWSPLFWLFLCFASLGCASKNCRLLTANHRGSSEILQDGRSKVTTLIKSSILEPFFRFYSHPGVTTHHKTL